MKMEYTTLDKICENLDSQRKPITSSDRVEGSIPYYGASGVVDYVQDYIFDERLLLVSEDGANLLARSTPIAFSIEGKTWVNNHAHVLRFADNIKQKYMELYLNSISLEPYITGSAQPKLNQKMLNEIPIPVVDRETMKMVVDAAEQVNQIISIRKKELEELDNLIKARFVELFGDPMTNSNGYVLKTYGELFELNAGGTPSKQKSEYWDNGTISWIGSNMCQNAVIYENDGNYITVEGLNHSSARMFPIDTVLIALVGATIGKTALLKFETTTNQNVLGVRGIRESGYTPEFIFYYTQGLYQKFLNIGDGGFAMASKGFISELPVPIVELELQEQFTAFAHQVDKSKVAVQKSLDEAQLLFDCLMQKYFG